MRLSLVWYYPFFSGILLGFTAIVLHECGHIASALLLGVRVKRVGLNSKGLFTVREQGTARENLIISLAGPAVNLVLVGLAPWFPAFALANVCCVLANTLPVEGSDGYRVAACWHRLRQAESVG